MPTYTGSSLKANAGISVGYSSFATGAINVYTAPANGYAIIHLEFLSTSAATSCDMQIGGTVFYSASAITSKNYRVEGTDNARLFYIGPSQSVTVVNVSGTNTVTLRFHGVEFINSP
jgi:hypothetical protein